MSGGRKLSKEDQALWNRVLQSVKPYHGKPAVSEPGELPGQDTAMTALPSPKCGATDKSAAGAKSYDTGKAPATAAPYFPPVSGARTGPSPALAPLDARQKKRLARGQAEIDGRLDLHGLRQSTAFHTLIGFLRRAQAQQMRTVLVITGKGAGQKEGSQSDRREDGERGVLRRSVPQWLSRSEFRDLVIGFEAASRRHGGDGALYVRIRRSK